jgi:imidazolonepropionase-like amidohydrolase
MQTLIKTSKLIDGTGQAHVGWSVLVKDGLIVDLAADAQFDGIEADVIDLTDGVVVPGLIDSHTHFCYLTDAGFQQSATQPNKAAMLLAGLDNAEEWLNQGVKIGAGTDADNPHASLAKEVELLTVIGMSNMEALLAATKTAAEILRLDKIIGTVEVGKVADLVPLDANPLVEIEQIRNIRTVVKGGEIAARPVEANRGQRGHHG